MVIIRNAYRPGNFSVLAAPRPAADGAPAPETPSEAALAARHRARIARQDAESKALLAEIEVFLAKSGMGRTTFGVKAAGRSSLVGELRRGACLSERVRDRVRVWMAAQP